MDHCEIPPIRTEFVEELGQGAFGKVHKAKLKDGLEYFSKFNQNWVNTTRKQKIVAVKELHGECRQLIKFNIAEPAGPERGGRVMIGEIGERGRTKVKTPETC